METDRTFRRILASKNAEINSGVTENNIETVADSIEQLESEKYVECKDIFNSEKELEVHLKIHRRRKNIRKLRSQESFTCNICNKVYLKASNLSAHMGTHTGFKPYECKICSKRFTQGNKLSYCRKFLYRIF